MQIYARDHVEVHPQKKKEVLYFIKKKKNNGTLWMHVQAVTFSPQ